MLALTLQVFFDIVKVSSILSEFMLDPSKKQGDEKCIMGTFSYISSYFSLIINVHLTLFNIILYAILKTVKKILLTVYIYKLYYTANYKFLLFCIYAYIYWLFWIFKFSINILL